VQKRGAQSPFVLVCDHAGRAVPSRLGDLGLAPEAFERHIAYDIGAAALAQDLGDRLGACLIQQAYSRLVIDCNREPSRQDAIPEVSDGCAIPANRSLAAADRSGRVEAVHTPYHAAIAAELDARAAAGRPTTLVLIHSFTPVMAGFVRPWHAGVLHLGNALSLAMLRLLQAEGDLVVGDNAPYAMDEIDYTAPTHAIARGLEYVELETRQDLISDAGGQTAWADRYARLLPLALNQLG
jgi:predicted N-formylglutamate amidohydrolase